MFRIGPFIFPSGLPRGTSEPLWREDFVDPFGQEFSICYTAEQIEALKRKTGTFDPYKPIAYTKPE
jgi:hypothetical protein